MKYMHEYHEQIIQNRHARSIREAGGGGAPFFFYSKKHFSFKYMYMYRFLLKVCPPPPRTHPPLWDHAYLNNNHWPILDSQHVFSMP